MSENIASSTSLGARPSLVTISSYSASVRPRSRCFVSGGDAAGNVLADRLADGKALRRAREPVDGVLGMRHEAEDVAGGVARAGDVAQRAVGVLPRRVAQEHLPAGLELVEH